MFRRAVANDARTVPSCEQSIALIAFRPHILVV